MGYLAMQNTVASVLTSEPGVADTVVDNRLLLLLGELSWSALRDEMVKPPRASDRSNQIRRCCCRCDRLLHVQAERRVRIHRRAFH